MMFKQCCEITVTPDFGGLKALEKSLHYNLCMNCA